MLDNRDFDISITDGEAGFFLICSLWVVLRQFKIFLHIQIISELVRISLNIGRAPALNKMLLDHPIGSLASSLFFYKSLQVALLL